MKNLKYNFFLIFLCVIILCITSFVSADEVNPGDKITIVGDAWLCPLSTPFCIEEEAIIMHIPEGTVLIIEKIKYPIIPNEPAYYLVTYKGERGWVMDFFTDKPLY